MYTKIFFYIRIINNNTCSIIIIIYICQKKKYKRKFFISNKKDINIQNEFGKIYIINMDKDKDRMKELDLEIKKII